MTSTDDIAHSHIDGSFRRQTLKQARRTVQAIVLTIVIAIAWASIAQINEITRGDGRVIPLRRMQTIQSLEGGILADLAVHEGDIVTEGEILVRLDPTRSQIEGRRNSRILRKACGAHWTTHRSGRHIRCRNYRRSPFGISESYWCDASAALYSRFIAGW